MVLGSGAFKAIRNSIMTMTGDGIHVLGTAEARNHENTGDMSVAPRSKDHVIRTQNHQENNGKFRDGQLTKAQRRRKNKSRETHHRMDRLRKDYQNVQTENKRLVDERQDIVSQQKEFKDGYDYVVNRLIVPYAEKKNLQYDDRTFDGTNAILVPLLDDALQGQSLRNLHKDSQDEIEEFKNEAHVSRNKVHALQNELQAARDEISTRAAVDQELRDQVQAASCEARDLQTRLDVSQGKLQIMHDQFRVARDKLRTTEGHLQHSKSQVEALQKDMLSRVDRVQVTSDERFAQDFRAIISLVKTLSRSIRLVNNVNVFEFLAPYNLLGGVPLQQWNTRARLKCYVEAWIWSVLIDFIFDGPFALFKKHGFNLGRRWSFLFGASHGSKWPLPSFLCEAWRTSTMQQLVDMAGSETIISGEQKQANRHGMSKTTQQLEIAVIEARADTANFIGEKLMSVSANMDVSRVALIIDKAISLVLQMSLQRSRLQITYPRIGIKFDESEMCAISDPDGDEEGDGVVAFIVNPGLTKWGDAHGRNFHQRYDIVPALVQLESTSIRSRIACEAS